MNAVEQKHHNAIEAKKAQHCDITYSEAITVNAAVTKEVVVGFHKWADEKAMMTHWSTHPERIGKWYIQESEQFLDDNELYDLYIKTLNP